MSHLVKTIQTERFGNLDVYEHDVVSFPYGLHGFPEYKKFCIYDPADGTFILWLQSLDSPKVAFPILEPRFFKSDYVVKLSAAELRELQLQKVEGASVFSILTLPQDLTQMTANLKAPIVINLALKLGRQVVLQENEYTVKHPMFKELKLQIVSLNAGQSQSVEKTGPVAIHQLPSSLAVQPLSYFQ